MRNCKKKPKHLDILVSMLNEAKSMPSQYIQYILKHFFFVSASNHVWFNTK